jgi:hypothetical protein
MESNTSAPARQRKPLQPVNVRARFVGGATEQDLANGAAVLSVTDAATGDEAAYWCEAVYNAGQRVGFRLRKLGSGALHDLPGDLSGCDCGDRTHRPDRPGGCRHMAALRQALPTVTAATA